MNQCLSNQVAQLADAVNQIERVAGDRVEIKREVDDMKPRLHTLGRQFPPPSKPIPRGSKDDIRLQNAHDGLVLKIENRRRWIEEVIEPVRDIWDLVKFLARWAWVIVVVVGFIYIRREFFRRDVVIVKHVAATVPDKERRRRIAEGSPVGRVFDRIKSWYAAPSIDGDDNRPTDAPGRDKPSGDVQNPSGEK